MLLIQLLLNHPQTDGEAVAIYQTAKMIDDYLVIPGVLGSFLTGLCFSLFTRWGFFKHRWITVKYLITLEDIVFGALFFGTWVDELALMAADTGLKALGSPIFITTQRYLIGSMLPQVALIVFVFYLSLFKPWNKRRVSQKKTVKPTLTKPRS